MKQILLRHRAAALLLVIALLAGCAVVTVDVDVYKGPLANTQEIQGEQVVSLVMGAKPLLVQLRDHLEVSEPKVLQVTPRPAYWRWPSEQEIEERLRVLRMSPSYEAGYMPPLLGGDQTEPKTDSRVIRHRFTNELALRINDVLGLYEDRVEGSIAAAVREAREWLQSYQMNFYRVEPDNNQEIEDIWKKNFLPRMNTNKHEVLIKAYKSFLLHERGSLQASNPHFRSATPLFSLKPDCCSGGSHDAAASVPEFRPGFTSYNYQTLKDTVVRRHGELLFGNSETNAAVRKQFESEVTQICDSFLQSRVALRGLLRLGLFNLTQLKSVSHLPPAIRDGLLQELAGASAQLINASALQRAISNSISSGGTLAQFTNIFRSKSLPNQLAASSTNQLEFAFMKIKPSINANLELSKMTTAEWKTNAIPNKLEWRRVVTEVLVKDTGRIAFELLSADQYLAAQAVDERQPSDTSFVFGLAINPEQFLRDFGEAPTPENLFGRTLSQISKQSGPLDGGRLPEGLQTLIQQYLAAANGSRDFANRINLKEGEHLLAGLTQFGQKTASLGNLAPLISKVSGNDVKRYISVLQGVGNSVLVHVDELKQSARHEEQLKKRGRIVATALYNQIGTNLVNGSALDTNLWKSEEFDAREAAEQLVTELRAEYVRLLRESEVPIKLDTTLAMETSQAVTNAKATVTITQPAQTNTVSLEWSGPDVKTNTAAKVMAKSPTSDGLARYREALERAIEIRAGLIHLRPASSYLRSSYPASTLRRSTLTTGNMLSQQAMRQIPLVGGLADGYNNQDLKTFLELDQQSWQNVNKVRVAGAGDVNYAIAKDDVGNWYVKAYETDPGRIFRSMRNMAAFSLGGTFGHQLPIRSSSTDQVLAATNGALQRQITTAVSDYRGSTTNELMRLREGLNGLKGSLPALWSKATLSINFGVVTNAFGKAWDAAEASLKQSQAAWDKAIVDKKDVAALVEIAEAEIPALLKWGTDLHRKSAEAINLAEFKKDDGTVPGTDPEKAAAKEQKTRAVTELSKGMGELLKASVSSRNQAFDKLQVSLRVIKTGAESE
jgi:hypothetical protein